MEFSVINGCTKPVFYQKRGESGRNLHFFPFWSMMEKYESTRGIIGPVLRGMEYGQKKKQPQVIWKLHDGPWTYRKPAKAHWHGGDSHG